MTKPSAKKPRIYFSFRSPYSWFAARLLEKEGLGPSSSSLDYIPFFEPDEQWQRRLQERGGSFQYTPMPKDKHYYILQDVKRLARTYGVPLSWPVDEDPDWAVPHLTFLACRSFNLEVPFFWSAYKERWENGGDIWSWPAMDGILRGLEADPRPILDRAESEEIANLGLDALMSATRDGAFGVPFLINGHDKFWGVDRLSAFLDSLGADFRRSACVEGPSPYLGGTDDSRPRARIDRHVPLAPNDHPGGCG